MTLRPITAITPEQLDDLHLAEEDVPLTQNGYITEAGELYLADIERLSE